MNVDTVKGYARGVVMDQIDQRTTDAGTALRDHADNLHQISQVLRDQGQQSTANFVDGAADRLESVSSYLTDTDAERIVHDVENVARSQPIVTATFGLAAGFLAARILKASATQRYQTYGRTYGNAHAATDV